MNQEVSSRMRLGAKLAACALLALGLPAGAAEPERPSAEGVEFFEKEVRPLLVKNCYECHGADKQKGNLRLDWRGGWQQGGDSGPAIIAGNLEESLLISAIHYKDYEMPPSGKLKPEEIAVLENWVARGAPDPRELEPSGVAGSESNLAAGRAHWAYQPAVKHEVPAVQNAAWPRNEIDSFILAKLESTGLPPARDAEPQVLARRLYFDLIGLPPTPAQLKEFETAASSNRRAAIENLVDELLASPRFGERWGRHWLDVARYGESVTLRGFVFSEAWRYRDYVIGAFNADKPFNRFVEEQIAGDLLPGDDWQARQNQIIATTFLMLGNTNLEEQDKRQLDLDVVDEQLDVIGKAFLAQTIACARCHDHKFDPIPTKDYYALAGILHSTTALQHSNVSKWVEVPLPADPELEQQLKAHEAKVDALKKEIADAKASSVKLADKNSKATEKTPDVLAPAELPGIVIDSSQAKVVGQWQLSQYTKRYIGDGYLHDIDKEKGSKTLTFQSDQIPAGQYEVRLAYTTGTNRATNVPVNILHADGESDIKINERVSPPIDNRFVSLGKYRFEQNQGYVLVSNEGTDGHVTVDAVQFLPLDADGMVIDKTHPKQPDKNADAQAAVVQQQIESLKGDIRRMEQELKKLNDDGLRRPMVMTVREDGKYHDLPIHIRGTWSNLGPIAPRGFLQIATQGEMPAIPENESGRRQLAEWLASPSNPLTARVMVNRVWHWMFGAGLVRSTDNFGTMGDRPSHPELLDKLTVRFIEQGWSVKKLIREMALSHTYQLASQSSSAAETADPENKLLSHAHRKRLECEELRDAMLQISGQLRLIDGGPTFASNLSSDYGYRFNEPCRSVYVPAFRNSLPDIFEVFDYPDPSLVTGKRNTSTVAPQALFMLNHPSVIEQAKSTAELVLKEPFESDEERLDYLYRLTIGRVATSAERKIALDYLAGGNDKPAAWSALVQSLFASPDFRYAQ